MTDKPEPDSVDSLACSGPPAAALGWIMVDEDPDYTCPECGGDGMDDDVTLCGHCGGEGYEWWLP